MIRFVAVSCSIVWLLVFSIDILRGAEGSREHTNTIRIAYVSPVTTMAPIWIASEIGAIAARGWTLGSSTSTPESPWPHWSRAR